MALIGGEMELGGENEIPSSSAQTRSTLGAEAISVYSPPIATTPEIENSAEKEPTAKIGSLVTLYIISKQTEFRIYISNDALDMRQLAPQVQKPLAALVGSDKVIVVPYNDSPTRKQINLAQLLAGKKEGDTITLLNGDKAEIKKIVDIDNLS